MAHKIELGYFKIFCDLRFKIHFRIQGFNYRIRIGYNAFGLQSVISFSNSVGSIKIFDMIL